jgi:hypothetical protein
MRRLALAAAVAALSAVAPAADAAPPIPDWPLGFTCHMTQAMVPGQAELTYLFRLEGGPLLPVTDTGEQVSDVEVTCSIEVVPAAHPAVTLQGTSTSYAGVAYLPPQQAVVTTGDDFTVTRCSHLTWTDSTGAARTGGSCHTQDY